MATEGFYIKLCYFQLVILLTPVEELMNYMTNARLRLHVPLFSPEKLLIRVKKNLSWWWQVRVKIVAN